MNKKFFLLSLFICFLSSFFAEQYKIKDTKFEIKGNGIGVTREYVILQKYPIDKKKIFDSDEQFQKYIDNYKKQLESTRAFELVEINYEVSEVIDEINNVVLNFNLVDSKHFIAIPYPRYSSNSGLSFKIKARDSNFLGSMNTMNSELNVEYNDGVFTPGVVFNFDMPFKIGIFDLTWVNDYNLNYSFGEVKNGFNCNAKTGLSLNLPFEKVSFNFGLYQYLYRNINYIKYDDDLYFTEQISTGSTIKLATFSNFSNLNYNPSITANFNWDKNGINKQNEELLGPKVTFLQTLSNNKVTWNDFFRKGYDLTLGNSFTYNFYDFSLEPKVYFEGKFYWNFKTNETPYWNRFGICANLYSFYEFDWPTNKKQFTSKFGERLRGIIDDDCLSVKSAIVLNLDLPHNMLSTEFPINFINCDIQLSPFFDMALIYQDNSKSVFNPNDGYYCGGAEILVYPLRWPSLTLRLSLGFDLKTAACDMNILSGLKKSKEILVGFGLQY